jgi:hypothetical protein
MNAKSHGARRVSVKAALMPMLWFAPINAVICWTAAWVFRDHFEFMAVFIGIGCADRGGAVRLSLRSRQFHSRLKAC